MGFVVLNPAVSSPITKNWISNNPERTEFRGHIEGITSGNIRFAWSHDRTFPSYQECWGNLMVVKRYMIHLHLTHRLGDVIQRMY